MGESSKKHSRKSKLVERTYEDIEDTIPVEFNAPTKYLASKKIPEKTPETKPPLEFSVKIEEGEDEWYKEMIEREKIEKSKRKKNKKKKVKINNEKMRLEKQLVENKVSNEYDLIKITRGKGIICVDSSYTISKETPFYNFVLIVELLLLSPYTAYYGPINYVELQRKAGHSRSHSIHRYYCMLCHIYCMGRFQFMGHLTKHNDVTQVYYTVTKFPEVPTIICTTNPFKYMSDCVVADFGFGHIVNIVTDYHTAIKNVVTKWLCSSNQPKVSNGILSYKCYKCDFFCEFYSQFISHLNEKHDSEKLMITTEVLAEDKYFNVVASSEFKPAFKDLTHKLNQPQYKCYRCKKIFDSHDGYRWHYKRINVCAGCGVELPCNLMKSHEGRCRRFLTVFFPKMCPCKQEFSSSRQMAEHQITCKFGRTALVFNCLVCNYLAPSTVRLLIHQRLEHNVRSDLLSVAFKVSLCYVCNEKYVGSYNEHYCKERQEIVDCTFCGMLFQNEYFLQIHEKAYPPTACNYCEKYYQVSCALIEHGLKEHGIEDVEIKYKCMMCNILLDKPDEEGAGLSEGHILDLHKTDKVYIYKYKKIYISKELKSTYGYHTNIFPKQEMKTNTTKSEDIEDLIEKVFIKKSNIISKSFNSQPSKNKSSLLNPVHRTDIYYDLSKTINQEHNYDITQSSEIHDGSYDIDKVTNTNPVDESLTTKDMQVNAEIKLFVHDKFKKPTVNHINRANHTVNNIDNLNVNTEQEFKLEVEEDSKAGIIIDNVDMKVELNEDFTNILDSSEINVDMIKCEPDDETILVQTQVPVKFTENPDEAIAGYSNDLDFTIKSVINSDEEYENSNSKYDTFDKPPAPIYPEEIGLARKNNIVSNLVFETKEKESEGVDSNKAAKRKLNDLTVRSTKLKPNPVNSKTLSERNLSVTRSALPLESSHNTSETLETCDSPEQSLETQENCSKPKNRSVTKKKKRRLNDWGRKKRLSKKTEPFRGFKVQELDVSNNSTKISNRSESTNDDDQSNSKEMETQSLDSVQESGETTTADSVSIKSENMSDTKTDIDDDNVSVKVEIKEELYEEYETDLIIFDDANSSNESGTLEKFVEIKPERNIRDSPSKPKIYYCKKCQFTGHHKGYKDHVNLCRKDKPKRQQKPSIKKVQILKYNCVKCNLECDDLRDYLRHLPGHGYRESHCPCCNEGCNTLNKFAEHVLRHIRADFKKICFLHLDNKPMELKKFRCCNCKMIVDQEDFFMHWQVHFDRVALTKQPKDIRAAVMRAEFGDLTKSMALEEGLKKELCECLQLRDPSRVCLLCGKQFTRSHDIKRHIIEHLTMDALCNRPIVKSMKCQVCEEAFDFTDLYKRHMRDHASLPLYQCQICDKSFSDSSNFGKHKKVHDVFEFVCDICRRKFQSKSTLIAHMLLHEKHQTISCQYCLKKFFFPSTYKKHLKQHDKGTPRHSCTLCKTRFLSVKEQLNHEWREHGLRKTPVDCGLCDQGYRRFIDLRMHLKTIHGLPHFSFKNRKRIEDEFQRRGLERSKIDLVFDRLRAARKNDD